MSTTLKIRDETTFGFGGDDDRGFTLDVPTERITVRELIRARVHREVRDFNLSQPEYFRGLVQPTGAEPPDFADRALPRDHLPSKRSRHSSSLR
jgi:hypothetical protein